MLGREGEGDDNQKLLDFIMNYPFQPLPQKDFFKTSEKLQKFVGKIILIEKY